MFNKRHYQAIAQVMQSLCPQIPKDDNGQYDDTGYETGEEVIGRQIMWDDTVETLAMHFAHDNQLFKPQLFIQACQPGANVRARKVA